MDPFSYLSVLISIILGLAITQILKGVRGMVLARERVVPYWPSFVFAALLLAISVQSWWSMFGMRNIPAAAWTFSMFALVLMQMIVWYLLAGLVLPDFFGEHEVNLRTHYFAHRKIFFSLFIVSLAVSLFRGLTNDHFPMDRTDVAFQLFFVAAATGGLFTARDGYHKAMCVASAIVFAAYVALLHARLH
jgi:hypothetical protein